MELSEFKTKIARLRAAIEGRAADIGSAAGHDLAANIAERVIRHGQTANGGQFSPYSTTEVPAFFFRGKGRGSAQAAVKKAEKARTPLSYSKFRELSGLQSSPKNFLFTGEMWRNFGVTAVRFDGKTVHVTVGGKNADAQQKIEWAEAQEGRSIIAPSPAELKEISARAARKLQTLFDQNLR